MYKEIENESRLYKSDVLKADFKGIKEEYFKIYYDCSFNVPNVDESYDRCLSIYYKIRNKYVPIKRNTNFKKYSGQLSEETRGMMSKAALGVRCASEESSPASRHWLRRLCLKEGYQNSNWFWETWV